MYQDRDLEVGQPDGVVAPEEVRRAFLDEERVNLPATEAVRWQQEGSPQ